MVKANIVVALSKENHNVTSLQTKEAWYLGELKKTTTVIATGTSLNKRLNNRTVAVHVRYNKEIKTRRVHCWVM